RELMRLEAGAWLEPLVAQLRVPHPVETECALAVARAVPRVDVPVRKLALEVVRLDEPLRPRLLALLLVLDLDEVVVVDRVRERRDQLLLLGRDLRLGRLRQLELAERLLELAPHARDGAVRLGGDAGPDEVERQADRARLERREARRRPERLAVELLVDVDDVAAELRVDRVA